MKLVMAYYDNPQMLEIHKREWARYAADCELILVDDGSAIRPDLSDCPIPYQHFRVLEDRPWHQNAARNLAMAHARGWCLMTDMDHLLPAESAAAITAGRWSPGSAYQPRRIWPDGTDRDKRHPNTYLLHSSAYWNAGGYDESFCGYYGTDATFRRQLKAAGIRIAPTDDVAVVLYEGIIEDASTRGLGRKGSAYHARTHAPTRREMERAERPTSWLHFPWERVA